MIDLLRRNLFIVLGVSLPLALIAVVLIVQAVHRWDAVPPATPVVYVYSADWLVHQHLRVAVVEGALSLKLERPEVASQEEPLNQASLEVAVYAPAERELDRYSIDLAGSFDADVRLLAIPEALQRLELDASPRSPEGARLVTRRRSRSGLFGELFGFGGSSSRYRLELDDGSFDVPGHPVHYGMNTGFIAWVVSQ